METKVLGSNKLIRQPLNQGDGQGFVPPLLVGNQGRGRVVHKYLERSDLRKGFARVCCPGGRHEYLLVFYSTAPVILLGDDMPGKSNSQGKSVLLKRMYSPSRTKFSIR